MNDTHIIIYTALIDSSDMKKLSDTIESSDMIELVVNGARPILETMKIPDRFIEVELGSPNYIRELIKRSTGKEINALVGQICRNHMMSFNVMRRCVYDVSSAIPNMAFGTFRMDLDEEAVFQLYSIGHETVGTSVPSRFYLINEAFSKSGIYERPDFVSWADRDLRRAYEVVFNSHTNVFRCITTTICCSLCAIMPGVSGVRNLIYSFIPPPIIESLMTLKRNLRLVECANDRIRHCIDDHEKLEWHLTPWKCYICLFDNDELGCILESQDLMYDSDHKFYDDTMFTRWHAYDDCDAHDIE